MPAGSDTTFLWADVDGNGTVGLADALHILDGFEGTSMLPLAALDLAPCDPPDGKIGLADVLAVLDAFESGGVYPCPPPCE